MIALIQRVTHAEVMVAGATVRVIRPGMATQAASELT